MEEIYSHYGKPADVWKHLALCEIMRNEQPKIYVETNSACAEYVLSHTPEQQYGIYSFMDKANDCSDLHHSKYYELEYPVVKQGKYLGSPGLAMSTLADSVEKYIFFDIQTTPLNNIADFAKANRLSDKVLTIKQNSIIGAFDLLPVLPTSTLMHIDPYAINEPSANGYDYMDLFMKATEKGLKCFLWYGFNTLNEKKYLNDFISEKFSNKPTENLSCTELTMDIIQPDIISCNPGILGSGLLTSNLSKSSVSAILNYGKSLVELYKKTLYNGYKGSVHQDIITVKNQKQTNEIFIQENLKNRKKGFRLK
jgi:23S rRNA (adenine2030-N6)-methyltransferase